MADKTPVHSYYLSERAYNSLIVMAQHQRYLPFGTRRAKGLSEFLNDLSSFSLEDTRPPLVLRRHREEERRNRAPTWVHTRLRRSRPLKLTDAAIENYVGCAYVFGIIRNDPFAIGGPRRTTPYPTVAFVLEAIGLKWLTPVDLPNKLPSTTKDD